MYTGKVNIHYIIYNIINFNRATENSSIIPIKITYFICCGARSDQKIQINQIIYITEI